MSNVVLRKLRLLANTRVFDFGGSHPPPPPPFVTGGLLGFADRWGQPPVSAGVSSSSYGPPYVMNALLQVDWAALQPTDGGPLDLNAVTRADNNTSSTITVQQMLDAVRPTGGKIRLRVMAGIRAPSWVKSLGGTALPWYDGRTTAGGASSGDAYTIGRWWRTDYQAKYAALQVLLAAQFDSDDLIGDVTISGAMTVFDEPMIRQTSDPTSFTPNNRQTLLDTAGESQPYSKTADVAAIQASIDAHSVWANTRSSLSANPYQYVVSLSSAPSSDTATATQLMDYAYSKLGSLASFGNHSLRDNQQAYNDATGSGAGGNMVGYNRDLIGVIYPKMAALAAKGCNVWFQTDAPKRLGRLASAAPAPLTPVTLDFNDGAGPHDVLGGPALDLALYFSGQNVEVPRNYDPGSVTSTTYPAAAKFSSTTQAAAYRDALAGTVTPPPPSGYTLTIDDVVYWQYGAPLRTDGNYPLWGKHEALMGISNTSRDWYEGARPGVTSPYPATYQGLTYTAHNVWGQVMPIAGGMPAAHRDVRIQLDWPQVWHLENGQWNSKKAKADLGNLDGGYWNGGATYSKTINFVQGTHWRTEDIGYSIDCKPTTDSSGQPIDSTAIIHFFFNGFYPRTAIAAGAQVAIVTRFRLISDDPSVDISQARFMGTFAGDAFETTTSHIGSNGRNPPVIISRHKVLTSSWQSVGIMTGTEAQIRGYPAPPFLTQ